MLASEVYHYARRSVCDRAWPAHMRGQRCTRTCAASLGMCPRLERTAPRDERQSTRRNRRWCAARRGRTLPSALEAAHADAHALAQEMRAFFGGQGKQAADQVALGEITLLFESFQPGASADACKSFEGAFAVDFAHEVELQSVSSRRDAEQAG